LLFVFVVQDSHLVSLNFNVIHVSAHHHLFMVVESCFDVFHLTNSCCLLL
jgi:hypothetical protein